MKWVKIEDGCEMPEEDEAVIAIKKDGNDRDWYECGFFDGKFVWLATDFTRSDGVIYATHWARVELPEDMK